MGLSQTDVSKLYVTIFGRASEAEGNLYWQHNGGDDLVETADIMLSTQAAEEYFGDTLHDNQKFIEFIYKNTFGKTAEEDPEGINYWVNELNNGKTKGEVVASLITAVDEYANSDDPLAKEAHDQFKNRVEVSDYCVENQVEFTDFETFKGFINGVTADPNSVEEAHSRINEHLHSRTNVDNNGSDDNEVIDELSELHGDDDSKDDDSKDDDSKDDDSKDDDSKDDDSKDDDSKDDDSKDDDSKDDDSKDDDSKDDDSKDDDSKDDDSKDDDSKDDDSKDDDSKDDDSKDDDSKDDDSKDDDSKDDDSKDDDSKDDDSKDDDSEDSDSEDSDSEDSDSEDSDSEDSDSEDSDSEDSDDEIIIIKNFETIEDSNINSYISSEEYVSDYDSAENQLSITETEDVNTQYDDLFIL